nr:hypothetical protein [Tanacetum cinerariifolium]
METDKVSERYIASCFVNGLEAYDDYKVKKRNKVVNKELILALEGELYFVKFIINLEEDDVEPRVILGRSFMRLVKGIVDFGDGVITVYLEPDPFEEDYEKTEKRKSNWNKKRSMDNLSLFYQDIGTSSLPGGHLTQKEAAKEALAIKISQKFALLEEKDKVELDGKIVKEEEEAVQRIKGKALKEKDCGGPLLNRSLTLIRI